MIDPVQAQKDAEQLRLLSMFHYVVGGLIGLISSCLPLINRASAADMMSSTFGLARPGESAPGVLGWLFVVLSAGSFLLGWTVAICAIVAGRCIARRKWYVFCNIATALMAVTFIPLGTVLGAFTLFVLYRPSVKEAFGTSIVFTSD